jgi:energy-coupling factor transport system ATP-binding protein
MEEIIKVENLCFEYEPGLQTISNISFQIHKGEYVAILGHNGSGKSTIAKLLIGLLEKKSGEIYIDDYQLNLENLYKIREKVGIIFQNPDRVIYFILCREDIAMESLSGATVRDDIAFGLENICVPREQMDELINRYSKVVRMENFLDHEPTKLSGGQKQRVSIAGILAMSPSIIILDEATSMLDPRGRKEINELVRELKKQNNMTIISITHDIEEAKNADRVILLNKGEIVDCDKPQKILTNEKLLKELKLDIPFSLKIARKLQKKGYQIKDTLDVEELEKQLCQLHAKV